MAAASLGALRATWSRVEHPATTLLPLAPETDDEAAAAPPPPAGRAADAHPATPATAPADAPANAATAAPAPTLPAVPASEVRVPLPPTEVRDEDFDVSLELPAEGRLGSLLQIQLRVTNRSGALQALRLCFPEYITSYSRLTTAHYFLLTTHDSTLLPTHDSRQHITSYFLLTTHHSRLTTHCLPWRYLPWQALRLSFSENESFLFCGYKLLHFQLPPGFSHAVTFNLVPVRT